MRKWQISRTPPQNKILTSRTQRPSSTRSRSPLSDFSVEVHIRGELHSVHHALCPGLEEAVHFGEAQFPAFAERNPWIGLDSPRRRIWILLDPEPENTK